MRRQTVDLLIVRINVIMIPYFQVLNSYIYTHNLKDKTSQACGAIN